MRAADARRIVAELGLEDAVAKVVADAPPLSDDQLVALRHIFMSPNGDEVAPRQGDPVNDDTTTSRRDRASA